MAGRKKKMSEKEKLKRRREQKKESMRKARAKLRQDPEKHEEEKRMHREQYKKRKENGKVKLISQLSDREQRKVRNDWRKRAKKYREAQKLKKKPDDILENDTPPMTPEPRPGPSNALDPVSLYESPMYLPNKKGTSRKESGKKKRRQQREQMKRQIEHLQKQLNISEKNNAKLRQKLYRFNKQQSNPASPCKRVNQLLKGTKSVSKIVRKKLLFSELLQSKFKSTYDMSNTVEKRILKSATNSIFKKYRCQGYFTSLTSRWKTTLSHGRTVRKIKLGKLREHVKAFLENNSSSRLTAGKKETITRNKQKHQIRLLNDTLKSLHKKFLINYPSYKNGDLTVSYQLFCKLRPFWVLQPKVISRQTCLCKIHTNIALMVRSLKNSKMIKENTPQELTKSICCTNIKEECLERTCQECKTKNIETLEYDLQAKIKYECWMTKKVKAIVHGNEKIVQKTVKETVECSKQELFKTIVEKMPVYMQHVNNVNHQTETINTIKKNLHKGEVLLHIDFSENFNCKYSEEIQSTHFGSSKKQLTLHTSVLYYNSGSEDKIKPLCFCTVSENLRHDPAAIFIHLQPIFQELLKQVPNLETLHIQSDGPSTQYRNKKMFYILGTLIAEKTCATRCVWHFTETGHGKGAPDGVGGSLKRTADNIIAMGHDITGEDEFVALLRANCPGINVIGIDKDADEEIKKIDDSLEKINIATFKGTMKVHQVTWSKENKHFLEARRLSCITCKPEEKCVHFYLGQIPLNYMQQNNKNDNNKVSYSDKNKMLENKYVIVCFTGRKSFKKHYVGVITEEYQDTCKVNFLRRSGNKVFNFPQEVDEEIVSKKNIVKVLKFPNMNTRGCYIFQEQLTSFVNLE